MHSLIHGVIKIIFLWTQQKAESHMVRREHEVEEEEDVQEEEAVEEADDSFSSQHECPLIQQKVNKYPVYSSGTFNHSSVCVPPQ